MARIIYCSTAKANAPSALRFMEEIVEIQKPAHAREAV